MPPLKAPVIDIKKISRLTYVRPVNPHIVIPSADFTNASGRQLNPQGRQHSLVPSGMTVLGSDKVKNSSRFSVPKSSYQAVFITPAERARWKEVRETFSSLSFYKPASAEFLPRFLRHSVPPSTFEHIQKEYAEVTRLIAQARQKVNPIIVYASLPGEGTALRPEEVGKLSGIIQPIILKIRELRTALPEEPFLEQQQRAWEQAYSVINPWLASVVVSPTKAVGRTDKRVLKTNEFNLANPDGTDYLLPRSETLLVDPDDLEEMDSYAAVRAKMANPPITQADAEIERAALLDQLPSGLRIALINDDLLPRLNFENWAKKGYLGHNATLETFPDGNGFMEKVRHGVKYDLVITDLLVPFGGIAMMPKLRELNSTAVVIASSKFDRGEEDETKLFNLGFDGYLWYNTNLNEGAYGYIEYLRAMKNYYHYKALHNWQR